MAISLGGVIRTARLKMKMMQKDLAAKVKKEDGSPVTPQYINDLEHDRRRPSELVAGELARALGLPPDYLIALSGSVPAQILEKGFDEETAERAFNVFRRKPKG